MTKRELIAALTKDPATLDTNVVIEIEWGHHAIKAEFIPTPLTTMPNFGYEIFARDHAVGEFVIRIALSKGSYIAKRSK